MACSLVSPDIVAHINSHWHRVARVVKAIVVHISKTLEGSLTTTTESTQTECSHTGHSDDVRDSLTGHKPLDRAFCI